MILISELEYDTLKSGFCVSRFVYDDNLPEPIGLTMHVYRVHALNEWPFGAQTCCSIFP